jgi:hypothetical protein
MLFTSAFVLAASMVALGQQVKLGNVDGVLLAERPCTLGPYEEQSSFTKRFYSREEYESARSTPSAECFRISTAVMG